MAEVLLIPFVKMSKYPSVAMIFTHHYHYAKASIISLRNPVNAFWSECVDKLNQETHQLGTAVLLVRFFEEFLQELVFPFRSVLTFRWEMGDNDAFD